MPHSKSYLILAFLACLSCQQSDGFVIGVSIGTDHLHDVEAISNKEAFAYSYGTGNIYHSNDGGRGWNRLAHLDSVYFEQIQFIDTKTGWICGEQGKIYRTVNGGIDWEDISINLPEHEGNLLLYALYFDDELHGIVAGMSANFETRKRKVRLYQTKNGGRNWTEKEVPTMLMNIVKGPESELWGMGSGMVLVKENMDAPWKTVLQSDSLRRIADIRSLDFGMEKGHVIAAEFSTGKLHISKDHGKTWTTQAITKNRVRSIIRYADEDWLAVGDLNKESGNVYWSHDDGLTWQRDSLKYPDIHRLALSRNYVWAVGKDGYSARLKR
ncbi:MAG: hypothetical protein HEP71_15235 [Roseivirga sp.]|nr:hypothetical protein [Roseivirga sp.]